MAIFIQRTPFSEAQNYLNKLTVQMQGLFLICGWKSFAVNDCLKSWTNGLPSTYEMLWRPFTPSTFSFVALFWIETKTKAQIHPATSATSCSAVTSSINAMDPVSLPPIHNHAITTDSMSCFSPSPYLSLPIKAKLGFISLNIFYSVQVFKMFSERVSSGPLIPDCNHWFAPCCKPSVFPFVLGSLDNTSIHDFFRWKVIFII